MSNFDRLNPALQHHIVNSLGWRDLRPFQEATIPPILAGENLIILAPTAGGKTEAALFPVLSRALSEGWKGLSLLYICPIKALLNNLDIRLQRYCTLIGRRSALWHGDVTPGTKKRILKDPPDCLLTTPESLEVMLVSPNIDARVFFEQLRVVIIDEIHAFAGDDRGWHLLCLLQRITKLAGRELQRIGLSATVGNPEVLAEWLSVGCERPGRVLAPPDAATAEAEAKLDFVGSLNNAAMVISRLHRGEKRLVFIDSRARAEALGAKLRQLGVTTFVTHSSLSREQRHQAEEAFASRSDCVIVATSALELGIDVGDLDRVIQIDAPPTVSSLLQRMGRTGRRAGSLRNCLFLATRDATLIQAAGLIDLWAEGYVDPTLPPPAPYHILAQQIIALALQERGIGRCDWRQWLGALPAFAGIDERQIEDLVEWMLAEQILWDEEGILWLGRKGEESYGRKNFLELFSVFSAPPLFSVLHGREELGFIDEFTFLQPCKGPRVLLLGGRAWQVNHIDWHRKVAYVEPTQDEGRSLWRGESQGLNYRLCQSMKRILAGSDTREEWSRRAREQIQENRDKYPWLEEEGTFLVGCAGGGAEWWTFAGSKANATLANELGRDLGDPPNHDSLKMTFKPEWRLDAIRNAIDELRSRDAAGMHPDLDPEAIEGLKFKECLPDHLSRLLLTRRLSDGETTRIVLWQPFRSTVDR